MRVNKYFYVHMSAHEEKGSRSTIIANVPARSGHLLKSGLFTRMFYVLEVFLMEAINKLNNSLYDNLIPLLHRRHMKAITGR